MRLALVALLLGICQITMSDQAVCQNGDITVTIIYDNLPHDDRLETDWGFAALIETDGGTILFDTGTQGPMFMRNLRALGKDPSSVDAIVISHAHGDHTGGLGAFFETGARPPTFLLGAFPEQLRQGVGAITTHLHMIDTFTDYEIRAVVTDCSDQQVISDSYYFTIVQE